MTTVAAGRDDPASWVSGAERMARRLRDALPGGQHPLCAAVWEFLRPLLSPRLVELHRDAFVFDDGPQSTVDLAAHRGESSLEELDLGEPGSTPPEPAAPGLQSRSGGQRFGAALPPFSPCKLVSASILRAGHGTGAEGASKASHPQDNIWPRW